MTPNKSEQSKCSCVESVRYADDLRETLCKKCQEDLAASNKRVLFLEKKVFVFSILFAILATLAGKEIIDYAFSTFDSVDKIENLNNEDSHPSEIKAVEEPSFTADSIIYQQSNPLLSNDLGVGLYDYNPSNKYLDLVMFNSFSAGNTHEPMHDYDKLQKQIFFTDINTYDSFNIEFNDTISDRFKSTYGISDIKNIPSPYASVLFLFAASFIAVRSR